MKVIALSALCLLLAVTDAKPRKQVTPFIVGGQDSAKGRWPWQVSMQVDIYGIGYFQHSCGAVIIDKRHALCAAHCFMGLDPAYDVSRLKVYAGAFDLRRSDYEQVLYVDTWFSHSGFAKFLPGLPDDIAVIRFTSDVDLSNPNIGAIKLASDVHDFAGNPDCWITGWGRTHKTDRGSHPILQELNIPVYTNQECEARWAPAPIQDDLKALGEGHICLGEETGTKSGCQGDSGGPLSCKLSTGTWVLAGITSRGWPDCEIYPSVYTRVSKYLDWVDQTIGKSIPRA